MKKILGFSLVELMISLIVISIVTAAFAPVLTKKLKTSDQSIGTATAVSITSSAVCNSISKGCIECENDKCLAPADGYFLNESTGKSQHCNTTITGCAQCDSSSKCTKSEDGYYFDGVNPVKCPNGCLTCNSSLICASCKTGYYLNGSSCALCSSAMTGCSECSSSSACSKCSDFYFLNNSKCSKCSAHCIKCSNASSCTKCETSYLMNNKSECYLYDCEGATCVLTTGQNSKLSIYRYSVGSGDGAFGIPSGINVCIPDGKCPHGKYSPICWQGSWVHTRFTGAQAICAKRQGKGTVPYCIQTVCNADAARIIQSTFSSSGWHVPNYADFEKMRTINFADQALNCTDPAVTRLAIPTVASGLPSGECYPGYGYWCEIEGMKLQNVSQYGSFSAVGYIIDTSGYISALSYTSADLRDSAATRILLVK